MPGAKQSVPQPTLLADISHELLPQRRQRRVQQVADVADAKLRDATDFAVTESRLEFQSDDFLLVLGEPREQRMDLLRRLLLFVANLVAGRLLAGGSTWGMTVIRFSLRRISSARFRQTVYSHWAR